MTYLIVIAFLVCWFLSDVAHLLWLFSNDNWLKKSFFPPIVHGINSLLLCGLKFLFRVFFCFWIRSLRSLPLLTIVSFVWLCLIWLLSHFSFSNRKLGKIIIRTILTNFVPIFLWKFYGMATAQFLDCNFDGSIMDVTFWAHLNVVIIEYVLWHRARLIYHQENLILTQCCYFDKIDGWTLSPT